VGRAPQILLWERAFVNVMVFIHIKTSSGIKYVELFDEHPAIIAEKVHQ
jgi:hypothetical protein